MSLSERLRRARIAAGYETSADAARAFGWNVNTVRSNENGNMLPGRDMVVRYANAYRVRADWLLDGRGAMRSARALVKVVGHVGAGAAVYPIDDGIESVEPPYGVPEDAVAFYVRGDSMWPAYREGTYLVAREIPVDNVANSRAIVTLEDGRRLVKDVAAGSRKGFFTLYSVNHAPIVDVKITAAAKVIGTIEP